MTTEAPERAAAREKELDGYEARFGKYVNEHGTFGKVSLQIGSQSFAIERFDADQDDGEEDAVHRRWYKRMLCNALHNLVEEQNSDAFNAGLERAAEILETLIAEEHFSQFDDERAKGRCSGMVECLQAISAEKDKP